MKKITEIYIQKEYMKSERDAFGNRIKIPTTGRFKRNPILVNQGPRFLHFLIDVIVISLITYLLTTLLSITIPQAMNRISMISFRFHLFSSIDSYNLFSYIIFVFYYFISEKLTQRSIGKFVTNTVVIDEYGNKPSTSVLLMRSFSRIIPFEAFSCFSERGWHDKISKTFVVRKSEALELKRLLLGKDEMYISDSGDILD